jgi:nucleotide-binding universal stress UspA family protein
MIKRIVVALDPSEDTSVAIQYSIRLAKRFQASLSGLAVVDVSNIPFNAGIGALDMEYYGEEIWEGLTRETKEVATRLLETFQNEVEKAGVRHRKVKREGASWERIVEETKYHDLLVIGRDSRFFYNEPQRDTKTLAKVVKNGVSSTLVVTDEYRDVERVMVAYDGSAAAARSLKSFIHLLPYGKDIEIDLVYVREGTDSMKGSVYAIDQAAEYLKEHNFRYIQKVVIHRGVPSNTLLELQKERKPDLILIGAHSVSALRRVTFGSNTHTMITQTDTPLFLSS